MIRVQKWLSSHIAYCIIAALIFTAFMPLKAGAESRKFNMSYLYNASSDAFIRYVDAANGLLQTVSPDYFDIGADSTINTQKVDPYFIKEMHKRNIRVVPFVSNHWKQAAGKNALLKRNALAGQIANAVAQFDLDGINIDIEGLNQQNRLEFTDFIRILRSKIPANKEVSVAVAANPYGRTTGWQGMYDYRELAKYSDYLMIMAYDESWEGSIPGPVASISFVEKSIQYALSQNVPKQKIVLGIPFYGRIWNTSDIYNTTKPASEKVLGKAVSLFKVGNLLSTFNARVEYVAEKGTAKAVFQIKKGDPGFKVNSWSKPLSPGTYELWFENDRSIKAKLELVVKYDLKGTGSWSLGQEYPEVWDYYSLCLNGKYFWDTENHWAQEAILAMKEKGWMVGTSQTRFSPNLVLSRAQAAVVLTRVLGLDPSEEDGSSFEDVPDNYWAKKEIETARKNGIISGMGDGRFAPEDPLTREQMAMLLYKILERTEAGDAGGSPSVDLSSPEEYCSDAGNVSFRDVNPERWSYEAIAQMNSRGIFIGYPDGSFKPAGKIDRAQMAVLMYKISGMI